MINKTYLLPNKLEIVCELTQQIKLNVRNADYYLPCSAIVYFKIPF